MGSCLSFLFPSSFASPPPLPPPPLGPPPQIKYDVFLSFRGEDTRYNFITHLHKALQKRGINTFIDYDLNRGEEISPALLTAIEESQIFIIIFSKNYASSRWCLEELTKILECKNRGTNEQIAIPVFYGVTPSDLRSIQSGSFAGAFAMHEKRFKQNVHRWKHDLREAADLSGWPSSADKSEADLIEDVVEDVWKKLGRLSSSATSNLVGIDSKIEKIESLLRMETDDVRSVGIWGIGGIGKTTLAEVVFNKISRQFKGCSYFARNVRERCEQSDGVNRLQQELLSALLADKDESRNNYIVGSDFIKDKLGRKKLLIVFDDVSSFKQIEGLIGGFDCLGPQSRIIITTRDRKVLVNCKVNEVYEVQGLTHNEALELFCMFAFRSNRPLENYMELSERVVKYVGGMPLALKVLGSHLDGKKINVWESEIEKMGKVLDLQIYEMLKISYDGLDNETQRMFLDIACFFKQIHVGEVKSALTACGFHTYAGIDVLVDKSLIAVNDWTITMHDLVEGMAKEIVSRESIDPSKRSRLWEFEEIYHVLTRHTGTETIEGIVLDMSKIRGSILLHPGDFIKMHRLRILKFYDSSRQGINKVLVSQGAEYNFSTLRYLSWDGYCSINSPLSRFSLENLVILDMRQSKLEQLWKGAQPLPNLKKVDLSSSALTSCPDLSGSPNLKELILSYCGGLREISPSIGRLHELEDLELSFCCSLKAIPEFPCNPEFPSSFGNLSKLKNLCLYGCEKFKRLPSSICKLKSLQTLNLTSCSELDQLPKDIGGLSSLRFLYANKTAIRELPSSIIYLKNLQQFTFRGFKISYGSGFRESWIKDDTQATDYRLENIIGGFWQLMICKGAPDCRMDVATRSMTKCLSSPHSGGRWRTALEVLSPLCYQILRGLSDFEDTLKNAFHALQKVKKANIHLQYLGSEVPKWFHFHFGSTINLSPNWPIQSFMGFALCFVVVPWPKDSTGGAMPDFKFVYWTCKLKPKGGQSFIMGGKFKAGISMRSNNVFVRFPFLPFSPDTLCDAKEISVEIKIEDCNNRYYEIEKCGMHLMYAQDIEEVDGISTVCEDENILSSTNVHHNCEEMDEPYPKRLKRTPY